jgi:hypothetical protein
VQTPRRQADTSENEKTMNKSITATIANTEDIKTRLKVGAPLENKYGRQIGEPNWATGVSLKAVYIGRRWFVVECYSIWDRGNGTTVGTYYTAYDLTSSTDRSDILRICERLDIEPPAKIEAVEA